MQTPSSTTATAPAAAKKCNQLSPPPGGSAQRRATTELDGNHNLHGAVTRTYHNSRGSSSSSSHLPRISAAIGSGVYYVYLYNELVEKPLSVYPPAASSQIKSALYHASRGNVAEMASSFKTAIAAAEAAGMHPLSDEVAGLKIECAQFLLKMKDGAYAEKGAQVLEHVLDESAAGAEFFEKEGRRRDRNKVLMRAVLLGYKIGEIYQGLGKDKEAGEAMAWSTETLLKETKRREETKVDEKEEGDWFDDVAMSACFESNDHLPHPLVEL